jgi:Cof subfamily protein (haloacid dehalogenase superfamily)
MTSPRSETPVIRAVVSDVDGTLVTSEKFLTERAIAAVAELLDRGIPFTIISSRPPRGMRMLLTPLRISLPIAAFNGGIIATPQLDTISEHLISHDVARRTLDLFQAREVQTWAFSGQDWLVRARDALTHVRDIFGDSKTDIKGTMANLNSSTGALKIVGVSQDRELLARCEKEPECRLTGQARSCDHRPTISTSRIRLPTGDGLSALADASEMSIDEITVIGDGRNDIAMFVRSGFSVAMGNASAEVKANASEVTAQIRRRASPKQSSSWCYLVPLSGLQNRWRSYARKRKSR